MNKIMLALLLATAQPAFARDLKAMFEDVFPAWVANSAWLDYCPAPHSSADTVKAVLDQAEELFFPGWLDGQRRAAFRDDMDFQAVKAQVEARDAIDAGTWKTDPETCLEAEKLEKEGRRTVGQILKAAAQGY